MNGNHEKSIEKLFDRQNGFEKALVKQATTIEHLQNTVDKMLKVQESQRADIHKISIQLTRIAIVLGLIAASGHPYITKFLP